MLFGMKMDKNGRKDIIKLEKKMDYILNGMSMDRRWLSIPTRMEKKMG